MVSPEIHDDNTVTFRLKAPKAVRVQVTGDFLPPIPVQTPRGVWEASGIADLKEGKDGVWEFTTPEPLGPELYSYSFIVDGLKMLDPANVYINRDVATVTNIFIIGGGRADLYKVSSIPAMYLIDAEGVMVGENLRGEALAKKLAELLK